MRNKWSKAKQLQVNDLLILPFYILYLYSVEKNQCNILIAKYIHGWKKISATYKLEKERFILCQFILA